MLGRDTQKGTPFLCIKRRPLFIGKYGLGPIRWVLPVVRVIAGIRGRAILLSQELRKHRSFLGPAPLSEGVTHPLFLILPPCGARPRARGAPARGRGPLRARDGFRGGGLALRVAGLRRLARPVPLSGSTPTSARRHTRPPALMVRQLGLGTRDYADSGTSA
jgi:hypothetical protein